MSAFTSNSIDTLSPRDRWLALSGVGLGVLMATIDSSIVNISLPTLVTVFQTSFAAVQWVVLSYILVITSLILGVARLGDMFNKKMLYMGGLVLFTVGSFLCAQARDIYVLIGFRALQGLGAVLTQALGMAIVTQIFPSSERGRALGIVGSMISIGIAIGPPLGGLIIAFSDWSWIFLVNLPIGVAALTIVYKFVPNLQPVNPNQRFDFAGAAIMFVTLACFALALTMAETAGFASSRIIGLLAAALIGLALFISIERRLKQPMIDLRLFQNVLFDMNLAMAFLVFIVLSGLFIIPFYLELVLGLDTTLVGLLMMVQPITMAIVAPVAGALSDKLGSRAISVVGLVLISLGALSIASLQAGQTPLNFAVHILPMGLGIGMFQSPNNSAIMGAVPRERLGIASGLLSLSRTLAQTTGLPVVGALFTHAVLAFGNYPAAMDVTQAPPPALVSGIHQTFLLAAFVIGISILIAVAALWLDERRKRAVAMPGDTF